MLTTGRMKKQNRDKIKFTSHEKEKDRKRRREVATVSPFPILSLPEDLVVKILAHVAASPSSWVAFFRAKLCCKFFNKLSDDNYIYRHISIKEVTRYTYVFPDGKWGKKAGQSIPCRENQLGLGSSGKGCNRREVVFDRCLKNGNLEAMYWVGMRKYFFEDQDYAYGLALLERAASGGHLVASYVFGIVSICKGGESIQRGLELIDNIKTGCQMRACRGEIITYSWGLPKYRNEDSLKPRMLPCLFPNRNRITKLYLRDEDNDENLHCKSCRLNREIIHVWDILTDHPDGVCFQNCKICISWAAWMNLNANKSKKK